MSTIAQHHSVTWTQPTASVQSAVTNAFKAMFGGEKRKKSFESYDELDVRQLNDIGLSEYAETNAFKYQNRIDSLPFEYLVFRL